MKNFITAALALLLVFSFSLSANAQGPRGPKGPDSKMEKGDRKGPPTSSARRSVGKGPSSPHTHHGKPPVKVGVGVGLFGRTSVNVGRSSLPDCRCSQCVRPPVRRPSFRRSFMMRRPPSRGFELGVGRFNLRIGR